MIATSWFWKKSKGPDKILEDKALKLIERSIAISKLSKECLSKKIKPAKLIESQKLANTELVKFRGKKYYLTKDDLKRLERKIACLEQKLDLASIWLPKVAELRPRVEALGGTLKLKGDKIVVKLPFDSDSMYRQKNKFKASDIMLRWLKSRIIAGEQERLKWPP